MKNLMTLMIMACLLSTAACTNSKNAKTSPKDGKPAAEKPQGEAGEIIPPADGGPQPVDGAAAPGTSQPAEALKLTGEALPQWKLRDVRVLMADTLLASRKNETGVIADNSLQAEDKAKFKIYDRGTGMMCTTETPADLKKGDTFAYIGASKKPWAEDQHGLVVEMLFRDTPTKRDLKFNCITRGEQTPEDFVKNMKDIVQFKNEKGEFPAESAEKDSAYYAEADNKFRSFRILKLEMLEQISVPKMGEEKVQALVSGKLMPVSEALDGVSLNKLQEACQITEVTGTLRTDAVYKWTDTRNLQTDLNRGIAMLGYTYNAGEADSLKMVCVLRTSAPFDILLETLAGAVEFGVAK